MTLVADILVSLIACACVIAPARAAEPWRPPERQCKPLIRAVLWYLNPKADAPQLDATLDVMQNVGMDMLWLLGAAPLANDPDDKSLEQIYTQADRRGLRVIIETSSNHRWFHEWDIPNLKEIERRNADVIARRYAHHPSFYAWYINYEIYMEWDDKSAKIRDLYSHIGRLTRNATPAARLTISPFYLADKDQIRGRFRYATPDEFGKWWTETIRQAGIDIVMLQDSGAVHCECVPTETRAAFFAAMQRACKVNGAELWGNVETVEHRAADWQQYAQRLKHYREKKTPYPWSFDMQRNTTKLDLASRFSTNIVTWGWEFWNPVRPQSEVGNSLDNYKAYETYYRHVSVDDTLLRRGS